MCAIPWWSFGVPKDQHPVKRVCGKLLPRSTHRLLTSSNSPNNNLPELSLPPPTNRLDPPASEQRRTGQGDQHRIPRPAALREAQSQPSAAPCLAPFPVPCSFWYFFVFDNLPALHSVGT